MSSSSFATERLIRRALGILESENPLHMRMFSEALGTLAIALSVDGEPLRLSCSQDAIALTHDAHGDVHVRTSLRVVPLMVRGDLSVVEAVRTGALEIHGKAAALHEAAHAIEVFLHGLVRCPSGKDLMGDLEVAISAEAT